MAPNRKGDLASIALRALAAGIITSLITSCVAGELFKEAHLYHVCSKLSNTELHKNHFSAGLKIEVEEVNLLMNNYLYFDFVCVCILTF